MIFYLIADNRGQITKPRYQMRFFAGRIADKIVCLRFALCRICRLAKLEHQQYSKPIGRMTRLCQISDIGISSISYIENGATNNADEEIIRRKISANLAIRS